MNIIFKKDSKGELSDFLTQKINQENLQFGTAYPFAFYAYNDREEIMAGCNGSVIFGAIYTDQLWVDLNYRKLGIGRKLLEHVHEYGRSNGCTMATVNTMDFQNAKEFYKKLGYVVDFERKGYANGATCIFLRKNL